MLMREHAVLSRLRYTPYAIRASTVSIGASRIDRRSAQGGAPSLRKQVEEVEAQLTVAALPLSTHVKEASDSVQQTATVARQERTSVEALHRSRGRGSRAGCCSAILESKENRQTSFNVETVLGDQLSVAKERTQKELTRLQMISHNVFRVERASAREAAVQQQQTKIG